MSTAPATDRLVPLAEVATLLGVDRSTLWTWRNREVGPPSFKVGANVVYRESLLLEWIAKQEAASTKGDT